MYEAVRILSDDTSTSLPFANVTGEDVFLTMLDKLIVGVSSDEMAEI